MIESWVNDQKKNLSRPVSKSLWVSKPPLKALRPSLRYWRMLPTGSMMTTISEKKHLGRVASLGCSICKRPAEVHHIIRGRYAAGRKSSHYRTIPLCPEHHRTGDSGVAIHAGLQSWEANFGSEEHYLAATIDALRDLP